MAGGQTAAFDQNVYPDGGSPRLRSHQDLALQGSSIQRHVAGQLPSATDPVDGARHLLERNSSRLRRCPGAPSALGNRDCLGPRILLRGEATQVERPTFCHETLDKDFSIPHGGHDRKLGLERGHREDSAADFHAQVRDFDV